MKASIYKVAMYEIVSILKKNCDSYDFSSCEYEQREVVSEKTLAEVKNYINNLQLNFKKIDEDTYCMIVCGTIMQLFISKLYDFNYEYFSDLEFDKTNPKMYKYYVNVINAIDAIREFRYFDIEREIFDIEKEFSSFFIQYDDSKASNFYEYLFEAIESYPEYSYAYCLITVPLFSDFGPKNIFRINDERLADIFCRARTILGKDLYGYIRTGNFYVDRLVVNEMVFEENGMYERPCISENVMDYVQKYDIEQIKRMEIQFGCYRIGNIEIPAGIPYRMFVKDECFFAYMEDIFEYNENGECYWELIENGDRVNIKKPILFNGLKHMMPFYEVVQDINKDNVMYFRMKNEEKVSDLLDFSEKKIRRLDSICNSLQQINEILHKCIDASTEEDITKLFDLNRKGIINCGDEEINNQLDKLNRNVLKIIERQASKAEEFEKIKYNIERRFNKYTNNIQKRINIVDLKGVINKLTTAEYLYSLYVTPYVEKNITLNMDYSYVVLEYYTALEEIANLLLYKPYKGIMEKEIRDCYQINVIKEKLSGYIDERSISYIYNKNKFKESIELGTLACIFSSMPEKCQEHFCNMKLNIDEIIKISNRINEIRGERNDAAHGSSSLKIDRAEKAKGNSYYEGECKIGMAGKYYNLIIELLELFGTNE